MWAIAWTFIKPIILRHWIVLAVVGVGLTYHKVQIYRAYNEGRAAALASVKKVEDHARKQAIEGARSVDDCYAADGVWDRSAGSCRIP